MQRIGHQVADLVAEHLSSLRDQPAYVTLDRASAMELFDKTPPRTPTDFDEILKRFRERVVAHHAREPHPRFLGYIPSCPTYPAVMGDWLATTCSAACTLWPCGITCASKADPSAQIFTNSLTPPHHSGSA